MSFEFAYPWFLLLYIPFVLLVLYAWKKPRPTIRIPSLKPFKAGAGPGKGSIIRLPFLLLMFGIAVAILALARPRNGIEQVVKKAKGIDIMIAIDLSGSMSALDLPRDHKFKSQEQLSMAYSQGVVKNRLNTAKEEIKKFIEERPNDRIGLIGFADLPYNSCPPTLDHAMLLTKLDQLEPEIIGTYTNIAGPVASAVKRLKEVEGRRILVLFTDGENTLKAKISPRIAAKLAKKYNIAIYTVGIGGRMALQPIQVRGGGHYFQRGRTALDEKLLKDIAKTTKGKYYHAADAKGMKNAMESINKMEKTIMEQPIYKEYKEHALKLVLLSMACLLLGFILSNTIFMRLP